MSEPTSCQLARSHIVNNLGKVARRRACEGASLSAGGGRDYAAERSRLLAMIEAARHDPAASPPEKGRRFCDVCGRSGPAADIGGMGLFSCDTCGALILPT